MRSLMKYLLRILLILLIFVFPAGAVEYVNGTHVSSLDNTDDKLAGPMDIGFAFPFYGVNYTQFNVTTNGVVSFGGGATTFNNVALPANTYNFPAVFPFWDDLHPSGSGNINGYILYRTIAAGEYNNPYGDNVSVVQWTNYGFYSSDLIMGTFQVHLVANGSIVLNYNDLIAPARAYGQSATIGIQENGTGNFSQHSFNTDAGIRSGYTIRFDKVNDTSYNKSEVGTDGFWDILIYKDGGVQPPGKPVNLTPSIGTNVFVNPTLRWDVADNAEDYRVVVSKSSNLNSPVYNSIVTENYTTVSGFSEDTTYYWQVIANNSGGETPSDLCNFNALFAPASVIDLYEFANGSTWINWTWTNPADDDFNHTMVYLNGTFMTNVTDISYNATGLDDNTEYELQTRTVDTVGNINSTWVNDSASTLDTLPPASVTGLFESNSGSTWIDWTWANPADDDFNHTMVYLDSVFKTNTTSTSYTATGLSASTSYNISTRTVDTSGNINETCVSDTASTDAAPTDSGGSSGGGVGTSDEPENVEETVFLRIYLQAGDSSTYNFNNVVTSVEVTPERTYGLVAAKIEVLFDQPDSITTNPPNGVLFKYVNVFVGTSGWSEGKFSSSVINFQIPASWFEDNNIDPASVTLYRHYGDEWQPLATTMTGQADGNYQYSAPTPGFSTFMILGQVEESSSGEPAATSGIVADPTPTPETTSDKGIPGFGIMLGIMGVLMAVYSRRK